MTRQSAFGIGAVSLGTAAVSCAAAVWLTNDLRAFGLGIIPEAFSPPLWSGTPNAASDLRRSASAIEAFA